MIEAVPIGDDEFARLMHPLAPFDGERRVVVAVSGGADSMALAYLLRRWGAPLAAVVDHGLRTESAAEAALTVQRLASMGVLAVILRAGLANGPARAERARVARYRLLLDYCRQVGRPDLLTAHHAHDQAETVLMRQARGSGGAGLAGMAMLDFHGEARLLRPLLAVSPARLRATLRLAGVSWVEDPSNTDLRTARARLRAVATAESQHNGSALAARAGIARRRGEAASAAALRSIEIRPEGFAVVTGPLGPEALSALIWTVSGRPYPPPRDGLAAGLAPRTFHGVLLRPAGRLGPGVLVTREPAAVAAAERARTGLRWDGRYRLGGAVPAGLSIGALGDDSKAFRGMTILPSVVLRGLPALRRAGIVWAVPHLAFPDAATCRSLRLTFSPGRPLVPAPFGGEDVNLSEGPGGVD